MVRLTYKQPLPNDEAEVSESLQRSHYIFVKTGTDTNVFSTTNSAMRHHKNSDDNMGTKPIALLIELIPQTLTGAVSSLLPQSPTVLWLRELVRY